MIKKRAVQLLTSAPAAGVFDAITRPAGVVFFLHRFTSSEGVAGHDPRALRAQLADLRARRVPLLAVEEVVRLMAEGAPIPRNAVAFTVDDGYTDFATVGAPLFAEFDCPVTVFVTTGCVDGTCWFWWDQIAWALSTSRRRSVTLDVDGAPMPLTWRTASEALSVAQVLAARLEHVADPVRHATIAQLARQVEVEIPARAPEKYAVMSWAQIRALGGRGVTFGPHTVTHPILSMTDDAQCAYEITESWRRLQESGAACAPVFCYPNGSPWAQSQREAAIVTRCGMLGALTTAPGYLTSPPAAQDAVAFVERVGYTDDLLQFRQLTRGLERAKISVRSSLARMRRGS
jgi:peptidoglycan/xylan/chitin deacetylase (PgdA/CDA1 family)